MTEQDPKSAEIPATVPEPAVEESPPRREDSGGDGWAANLRRRVLSGVPALFAVLAVIGLAPSFVVSIVMTGVGVMGMLEFFQLLPDAMKRHARLSFTLAGAGLIGLGGLFFGLTGMSFMLLAAVLLVLLGTWFRPDASGEFPIASAGALTLGLVMVPWVLNHLYLVHDLPGGGGWLAMLIVVVTLNDTLAYLVGSLLGSHPLMPRVSPNKTVEGALAGIAGGVAGALACWVWLLSFSDGPRFFEAVFLGAVLAVVAQCGDLVESKFKRLVGADDSGSFLPGHGGLLDRLDAYSLAAPVLYYYLAFTAHAA